jgi:hypothetical protein
MEQIIRQLIQQQLIRDNTSPYSSPALLVKKKDTTWRLVREILLYLHATFESLMPKQSKTSIPFK